MLNRRQFLEKAFVGGGMLALGSFPFSALAKKTGVQRLVILHTNDTHSHIDPFPMDGSKYQGLAGVARRASIIQKIRSEEEHVLLFDAGDIFEGTPYFNLYKGAVQFRAMSMMQYDAATIGNHEFDLGLEGLKKQLPLASFPFLTANYDFEDTILKGATRPYKIFRKGDLKIGVFGLGVELWGLVPEEAYGRTKYLDPLTVAKQMSDKLKNKKGCDLVVCLSHLGFEYVSDKVSDMVIAKETEYLDVIIGGHTHTFFPEPVIVKNNQNKNVVINQVGWAGIQLGKLEFEFNSKNNTKIPKAQTVIIGKETRG
jgi:5'-nucleotidase